MPSFGRRGNFASLRQIAELEHTKVIEVAKLLIESFEAIGDTVSGEQALALLGRLSGE